MPVPDFSPGEVLTAAAMDSIGLWKIAETSFTTAANPFINGCFSSDYQNYVVKIFAQASANQFLSFRLRSGTSTPETGAVYDRFGFEFTGAGSISSLIAANQSAGFLADIANVGNNQSACTIDLFGPNNTIPTIINTHSTGLSSGQVLLPSYRVETNTAYTGIELVASGVGTTLTGTMRVYGYRN
jgi:hypothetical protein